MNTANSTHPIASLIKNHERCELGGLLAILYSATNEGNVVNSINALSLISLAVGAVWGERVFAEAPKLQGIFAAFGPRNGLIMPNSVVSTVGYEAFVVKNNREFVAAYQGSAIPEQGYVTGEQGSLNSKIQVYLMLP